jgi:hypothetical protein
VRRHYDELPPWIRAVLRSVSSFDFRVTETAEGALDLLAVATGSIGA